MNELLARLRHQAECGWGLSWREVLELCSEIEGALNDVHTDGYEDACDDFRTDRGVAYEMALLDARNTLAGLSIQNPYRQRQKEDA